MPNLNELLIGFGKGKQADIATPNTVGNIWRLAKTDRTLANPNFVTENDSEWLGKGHEFATQQFRSHIAPGPHGLEKFLSSQFAAWFWSFLLGKVVKTGAGPYTYTCTPMNLPVDGTELPYFSYLEQMRPGGSDVIDRMLVGCALQSGRILLAKGPGLQNSRATVQFLHSGKLTLPSGITMPAQTAETLLNAYSLACTINGVNYVSAKTFESLEMGMDNNIRDGFFPGSGQQDSFQIQGRLEVGDRVPVLQFVARYQDGSLELDKVRDLTTGTAVISLTFDANNSMTVTFHQVAFAVAELGEADGIVTVQVTGSPQYHATNGLLTAVVVTPVDGIAQ